MPRCLTVALMAGFLASCGSPRAEVRSTPAPAPAAEAKAPIVVVVVLDQVGSWVLDRARPALPAGGLLRRCMAEGAYHHRVVYEHADTSTAPGHAVISTGASPSESGIDVNKTYSDARGKLVSVVDDGRSPVFGNEKASASPMVLRTETVGDVLDARTGGAARIVSLSIKDRAAVLLGGKHADAVAFFDRRRGAFTTSRFYADRLPTWLEAFEREHPVKQYLAPWTPLDARVLAERAGVDDQPGEGDFEGFGRVFPHDASRTTDPNELFAQTPGSVDMLLDAARAAVGAYGVGEDGVTDLVWISISATDLVGHTFGAESWEALDILMRTDLALARFVADLSRKAPVRVLVTADHGVTPLVEHSREVGLDAVRWTDADIVSAAQAALVRKLGPGEHAVGFAQPYLFLKGDARLPENAAIAAAAVREVPGVGHVFTVAEARGWANDADPLRRAVGRGIAPETRGDVVVFARPYSAHDDGSPLHSGASHGSPWPYDREVPVIVCGPGVHPVETTHALEARRIASTIAALASVPPPSSAKVEPLPGVDAAVSR